MVLCLQEVQLVHIQTTHQTQTLVQALALMSLQYTFDDIRTIDMISPKGDGENVKCVWTRASESSNQMLLLD